MKIFLQKLKDGVAAKVDEVYDPKELDLELVDLKFLDSLKMVGEVVKIGNVVDFKGHLKSRVKRICGKSLKEIEEDLNVPFHLYYTTDDRDEIDTVDDLREALLIDQPMVYYAPDADENSILDKEGFEKKESDAAEKKKKNPFDKLKQIRDQLKEE